MYYYLNGKIVPVGEAKISVRDIAILRGFGIFDFFRTQHGRPFMIDDYLERFKASAELIGLPLTLPVDELKSRIEELLTLNKLPEAGIRLVLTGGESPNAYIPARPNFAILIEKLNFPDEDWFNSGIKLIAYSYLREFSHIKSINYLTPILLQKKIKEAGAMDVLYHKNGEVSEVSRSNFFVVKNGTVITPDKHVLYGITRKKTIQLAKEICPVEERTVTIGEVANADECFITGTTKKVMPVVEIDGKPIGNGKPGRITRQLMALFRDFEENY